MMQQAIEGEGCVIGNGDTGRVTARKRSAGSRQIINKAGGDIQTKGYRKRRKPEQQRRKPLAEATTVTRQGELKYPLFRAPSQNCI